HRIYKWPCSQTSKTISPLLFCLAGCWGQSCNRTKAYFESRNFFSVLHWDTVGAPGQTLLYSGWTSNISTPVCDMTDVMTHVMSDVTSKYHVKVSAGGRCLGEVMFSPFWETTFAAPQLSVTSNQTHLNVTVSPPMAAWNCSIENIGFWGKGFPRSSVKYTVRLTHPESLAGKVFEDTSRSVFLWLVETDMQYCGDVLYTLTHPGRSSPSENASFCVTVSGNSTVFHIPMTESEHPSFRKTIHVFNTQKLSLLPVKQILPKNSSPAFCSYPRDDISKVEVWSGFVATFEPQAFFSPPKSETVVNDAYAPQEPCDQECTHDQTDIPVQDSPESSVHYSMIVPVQISIEPSSDGTTETHSDSFGPESFSSFLISHSDTENNSGPLVVPVRPTKNGALQFHDCLFQCDTGQNSPEPSRDSEGLSGEQTPLLSDLVQKDSRCSSSYLPLHVSDVVTSNYRQNWLPGIPLEGQQDQRTYVMRTDHLQDSTEPDEDFIDGEEPRVGVIFLDRWMVETQGLTLSCN
uniref:Uncharacterized LOC107688250 n=1 Tax=Sinocyclocheilus anshuiensis TaxID=1608454 RepID=A0A671K2K1_9TELE